LESPSVYELAECILSLNVNKAVGHDNIPAYFLKAVPTVLASSLYPFLDFSFNHGIFPENCKIAKVIPIHKTGDKSDPNNYRSISILTCLSKIFDKLIHKRITNFLDKKIYSSQNSTDFGKISPHHMLH